LKSSTSAFSWVEIPSASTIIKNTFFFEFLELFHDLIGGLEIGLDLLLGLLIGEFEEGAVVPLLLVHVEFDAQIPQLVERLEVFLEFVEVVVLALVLFEKGLSFVEGLDLVDGSFDLVFQMVGLDRVLLHTGVVVELADLLELVVEEHQFLGKLLLFLVEGVLELDFLRLGSFRTVEDGSLDLVRVVFERPVDLHVLFGVLEAESRLI